MKTTVVAALFVVLIAQGFAQSPRPRVWSRWQSVGPSCAAFLQSNGGDRDAMVTFTLGFFAGTNRERAGTRQVMFAPEETETRMEAYCRAHPTNPMASAGFAMAEGQ
jgi:hypothetical protein